MGKGYEEAYYNHYDIGSKTVSYLESVELRELHASVARELTAYLHPKTVLDAGCAMGVLVSEFIKQGVSAYGLDSSEYAVTHADPLARETCFQGSLAEPFPAQLPERFDLVTCIEVVEHMLPEEGRVAIANLCRVTDTIIFCSTPDDFADVTHVNVQEREYWAACFAENGFFDDLNYRPLFLTDYAVCYKKRLDWVEQLQDYERYIRQTDKKLKDLRDAQYLALEKEHEKAVAEWTRTAEDLNRLNENYTQLKSAYDAKRDHLLKAAEDLNALQNRYIQLQANQELAAQKYSVLREQYDQLRLREESLSQLNEGHIQREAAYDATIDQLQLQKKEQENRAEVFRQRAERAEDRDTQLAAEFETLSRRYSELENAYQQCLRVYNDTRECLDGAGAQIAHLKASASWRITAPLRWTKRMLKRLIGRSARLLFRAAKKLRGLGHRTKSTAVRYERNWPPRVKSLTSGESAGTVPVNCRRLGIYTVFDQDGLVDEYILYFLEALSQWMEKLIVVSNGPLKKAGMEALERLGCQVLIRENSGFDAWGVKAGIEQVGFDELEKYDEVVISNNTLFGPVCDLKEMFTEMSQRRTDFWGVVSHAGMKDMDPFGCNPYGYIPEHIQSFFYVIRGRMLKGEAFRRFWTEMPELPDYNAAVGLYETVMTRYFSDVGYTWSCYMNREDYYGMTDNPLIAMPMESIRDWGCPFFKRRAFFQDYDYLTTFTGQQSASCLMRYLQENTDYPVELVWKNLIRTCHMSDLTQNLHLSRIFDRDNEIAVTNSGQLPKAALFMHIYDHTMARELAGYAASLPPEADIFISTVSEEKKTAIGEAFANLPNRVEIRVLPNRGRDVSALLTSFRDVVMEYDVACVTHDKKTGYLKPQTVGEGFAYMGYENILGSKEFVAQVLRAFAQEPFLGMLYAPDPSHADFATHIGLEWGANFECTKQLAQELKLQVPMDEKHPPMAPFGSSFWFRTAAMGPLFAKVWTYEDFPAEPFRMTDGSVLHAIERIYPYVAQHAGYYSALLMTADYASVDIGNLTYYAQRYAHVCFENGIANRFITVRDTCSARLGPVWQSDGKSSRLRRIGGKIRNILTRWSYE